MQQIHHLVRSGRTTPFKRIPKAQLEKNEKYAEAIGRNNELRRKKAKAGGYVLEDID